MENNNDTVNGGSLKHRRPYLRIQWPASKPWISPWNILQHQQHTYTGWICIIIQLPSQRYCANANCQTNKLPWNKRSNMFNRSKINKPPQSHWRNNMALQCSGGTMPHAPLEFKFEFNKFVKKCASWTETIKPYLDVSKMDLDRFFPANCHQEAPMPTGRSHAFQELLPYGLPVTRFKQTWMKLNIGWCSHCIHVSIYSLLTFLSETTKTQTSIHLIKGVLTILLIQKLLAKLACSEYSMLLELLGPAHTGDQ